MSKKIINKIPFSIVRDAQLKLDEVMRMLEPYLVALTPLERQSHVNM